VTLTEAQIRRYARHVLLPDVGGAGQARLLGATAIVDLAVDSAAAIVAATYLAAAGVGTVFLVGGDRPATPADVAGGIALGVRDVGEPLGPAVAARLRAINADCRVIADQACVAEAPGTSWVQLSEVPGTPLVRGGLSACRAIHAIASTGT
jgi:molybdopterin-synthase adenylyltransferase